MARFFNTTGPCNPVRHYMLPPEDRLPLVRPLIEQQLYFTVHAARQTGKTTSFLAFARSLTAEGRHAALHASCETGQAAGDDVDAAVSAVIDSIESAVRDQLPEPLYPQVADAASVRPESRLAYYLEMWCRSCPRPVVLFLDEIDSLLDTSLVSVLRQLRRGFPSRPTAFPQSVALIGLRDVRDYKMRNLVRPESSTLGTASPFNVKARSLTLRS
ncbi:MAG: ATP-binding protein, partial [Deltaproteobacteria bacterium]|nr:ATP-binding protein [Deltaproteobacteria bacterium]